MTTSDLERRLSAVLHQHAEDAMNHTRTEEQLEALLVDAERAGRRRWLGWGATALVAAAAAIALVVWTPGLGSDQSETVVPAPEPTAEQVAEGFLEEYGGFDRVRAAAYLADSADTGDNGDWRLENRFFQAIGFRLLLDPCEEQPSSPDAALVLCAFDYHALGSDELGRGPFSDNSFDFTVQDGKIVAFNLSLTYHANGFSSQMWEPFAAWVSETHPEDGPVMYDDWPDASSQALNETSFGLWEQRTREYVAVEKDSSAAAVLSRT